MWQNLSPGNLVVTHGLVSPGQSKTEAMPLSHLLLHSWWWIVTNTDEQEETPTDCVAQVLPDLSALEMKPQGTEKHGDFMSRFAGECAVRLWEPERSVFRWLGDLSKAWFSGSSPWLCVNREKGTPSLQALEWRRIECLVTYLGEDQPVLCFRGEGARRWRWPFGFCCHFKCRESIFRGSPFWTPSVATVLYL